MPRWRLTIIEEGTADTREDAILMFDGDADVELPIDYTQVEYKIEEITDPWVTSTPHPEESDSEDPEHGVPRDAESDPAWGIGSKD